jgi:hypothetical protein
VFGALLVEEEEAEGGGAAAGAGGELEPELGGLPVSGQVEQGGEDESAFGFDGVGAEQAGEAGLGLGSVHDEADGQVEVVGGLFVDGGVGGGDTLGSGLPGARFGEGGDVLEGGVGVVVLVGVGEGFGGFEGGVDVRGGFVVGAGH